MARKKATGTEGAGGGAEAPAKPYVVLARKYRPQTFDDLIGQDAMVRTLRNAFEAGRIAQGYMLTGVRGVGKTTTARILARALNYETDEVKRPTVHMPGPGRHCAEIMESRHPDVIEMDAASNTGVDNVREIIESARYKPILARTKVFIIDEVHMLSKGAFNALLKTLEEPPEHVKFIFATTEIRKVPVTVLSRCQRFDLRRIDVPMLAEHLARIAAREGAVADDDAVALIARAAGGSVRDGLSLLDQAIAASDTEGAGGARRVTAEAVKTMLGLADRGRIFDLLEQVLSGSTGAALASLEALHHDGAEPAQVLADLAEAVHIAARIKTIGVEPAGETLSAEEKRRAGALGAKLSVAILARAWQMLTKGLEDAARAPDALAAVEMVLIRIAYTADLPPPDELIKALGGEAISAGRRAAPAVQTPAGPVRGPLNAAPDAGHSGGQASAEDGGAHGGHPGDPPLSQPEVSFFSDGLMDDPVAAGAEPLDEDELADEGDAIASRLPAEAPAAAPIKSFADVVSLTGARRDARLKVHLEEHVSLVAFDAAAGSIDLFLLPGAPPELANDLREKLVRWTGRRWIVLLSKEPGAPAIGEVRRAREAAERAELGKHPAVAAIFEEFPDARITGIRRIDPVPGDKTGTG